MSRCQELFDLSNTQVCKEWVIVPDDGAHIKIPEVGFIIHDDPAGSESHSHSELIAGACQVPVYDACHQGPPGHTAHPDRHFLLLA
jgi:hypothetical protein